MKILKYIVLALLLNVGILSCKKDFLNRQPSTAILETNAIKTANDMDDAVNGMYAAMTSSTWYGRDVPIIGDLLADNVYVSHINSGRLLPENNFTYSSTNGEALEMYTQAYYVILQANRILAASIGSSSDVKQLRGEAYIIRALNYLQLVNFFAHPATVAPNDPGVAIILTPTNASTPFIQPARATVSDVYKQIISDLDSAYLIMPAGGTGLHPTNSEYLSNYAAKAIESRAYLYEGDYANALQAASLVVYNGGYTLAPYTGLVAYWANPGPQAGKMETIFELAQTTTTNQGFDAMASMYSQDGYGDELVTNNLHNQYTGTDVRKSLIIKGSRAGSVLVNNKYSNFDNNSDKDDIKVIRYAEVMLTLSESFARTGQPDSARKYLNIVAMARDTAFKGYKPKVIGDPLLADIILERRKELAFEGLRYFDLTRLNVDIIRPQQVDSAPSINDVPVGNDKRIFPIPQAEMDANPKMVQNPGYRGN